MTLLRAMIWGTLIRLWWEDGRHKPEYHPVSSSPLHHISTCCSGCCGKRSWQVYDLCVTKLESKQTPTACTYVNLTSRGIFLVDSFSWRIVNARFCISIATPTFLFHQITILGNVNGCSDCHRNLVLLETRLPSFRRAGYTPRFAAEALSRELEQSCQSFIAIASNLCWIRLQQKNQHV